VFDAKLPRRTDPAVARLLDGVDHLLDAAELAVFLAVPRKRIYYSSRARTGR
jgi:hypothetical protein